MAAHYVISPKGENADKAGTRPTEGRLTNNPLNIGAERATGGWGEAGAVALARRVNRRFASLLKSRLEKI